VPEVLDETLFLVAVVAEDFSDLFDETLRQLLGPTALSIKFATAADAT
jgi:hypothetical protein